MNHNHPYAGTGVAIVTPFLENGELDTASLEKLVNHLVDGGVEYIVALGTTGENPTLNKAERQQVYSLVNQFNNGRIKLVAGIGGNDTRAVVESMQSFDLTGYSAILSVSPYYNKPNNEGLFQHYKAINDNAPLPIIMYNVPGRTGMNVNVATTLRIARECKNIIATKEASGNVEQIMQIIKDKPEGFEVISGDDGITLPIMACGAIGVISVVGNAYPKLISDMVRLCLQGKFVESRPAHEKMLPLISSMFAEGNPSGVKAYLSALGITKNTFRLPVVGVSDALMQTIQSLMKSV
ncbi:MAG: 4-hydroxy-tetrahydrodipicolinate synthase [Bacteroidota bacterium]|jgi:4-hydroxy-tetrahydrodipicolinate synthase|nr:4-hydroxy-tetrahydrodipicolinate synthase [Chitinophagaceae bacterium]MCE2849152.1 4-hydroxy-tetrahydrodipicolinate synthase [Chitinophagaceae bacterium]